MSSIKPKAIASGTLFEGKVDCYVLDDGRRVVSQRGILRALRGEPSRVTEGQTPGKSSGPGDGNFRRIASRLPSRFHHLAVESAIGFEMQERGTAMGFEAIFFTKLCNAYVNAFFAGELHPSQHKLAIAARAIVEACSMVGIEALVDEATGHQGSRPGDYLRRRVDDFLRWEAAKWERAFPKSLIVAICKLYGMRYDGGRIPHFLSAIFNGLYRLVLGDDTATELKRRNPLPRFGRNHHQFLQEHSRVLLTDDLRLIEVLADQSANSDEFWRRLRAVYRNEPLQLGWP